MFVPGFLAADVVGDLGSRAENSLFTPETVSTFGTRSRETTGVVGGAIATMLSRHEVLRWVAWLVGNSALSRAGGSVTRSTREGGEQLTWHDDLNEPGRRLGITIDLLGRPYEGGEFELRRKGDTILRHRHADAGGALLFAVEAGLGHRVCRVTSGGPRLVFAGWFS